MGSNEELNKFLEAIEQSFVGLNPKTNWPLNGAQIDSYFDMDDGLDMYYRIRELRKNRTVKQIADMLPVADVIRIFLQHNAIIGLKVAKKFNIDRISIDERVEYTLFLFEILREKVMGDIFCLDGKNILLDNNQIKEILNIEWNLIKDSQDKRKISFLTVMANNVVYSLFFDPYMTGGFYLHGPYDASAKFGDGAILLIREYQDLNPFVLWPNLKMPYKKMRILAVYKNLNVKINFVNHLITKETIGDKLIGYKIYLDDKELNIKDIEEVTTIFTQISAAQTKKVNSWSDLDKVRMGAKIDFYLFKKFREQMGDNWIPKNYIEETITKFGDEFIKRHTFDENKKIPSVDSWKRVFDPRDDYF